MTRLLWLINGVLVLLCLGATLAAVRAPPPRQPPVPPRPPRPSGEVPTPVAVNRSRPARTPEPPADLWRASLFQPTRSEGEDSGTPAAAAAAVSDFELVGIGIIGDEAAAIIVEGTRAAPSFPAVRLPGAPAAAPETRAKPRIYRLGDTVADSSFVVKEVRLDEVVLSRGGEERTLRLETGDAASRRRAEQAGKDAAARLPQVTVAPPPVPTVKGAPPPPPPPPGTAAAAPPAVQPGSTVAVTPVAGTTAPAAMTREERIRAALEARQRILGSRNPQP